jgi:hypothetical protein
MTDESLPNFETFVVEDEITCDDLIKTKLEGEKFVGFDCEWIRKNKISLLQIATLDTVLLIRVKHMVITQRLERFLKNSSVIKFGVSINRDGDKMMTDFKMSLEGIGG